MRIRAHQLWCDIEADGTLRIGIRPLGQQWPTVVVEILPHEGIYEGRCRLRHLRERVDAALERGQRDEQGERSDPPECL